MNEPIYIEHWITFTLVNGEWSFQVWAADGKPVNGKVYRLRLEVPPELVGAVVNASIEAQS